MMKRSILCMILLSSWSDAAEKSIRLGTARPTLLKSADWVRARNSHLLALSPEGQMLAVPVKDEKSWSLSLRDAKTNKLIRNIGSSRYGPDCIVFSPDGKRLATISGGRAHLWNAGDGKLHKRFKFKHEPSYALCFSSESQLLALADGATVQILEVRSGKLLKTLSGHRQPITAVRFSRDGKQLYSASYQGDLSDHAYPTTVDRPQGAAFISHDLASGKIIQKITAPIDVTFCPRQISVDGRYLACPDAGGLTELFQVSKKKLTKMKLPTNKTCCIGFPPDAKSVVIAVTDGTITLRALPSLKLIRNLDKARNIASLTFSSDGKRVVALLRGLIRQGEVDSSDVWELKTGKTLVPKSGHGETITSLRWIPRSRILVSSGLDGTLRLWDLAKQQEISVQKFPALWQLQISSDVRQLTGVSQVDADTLVVSEKIDRGRFQRARQLLSTTEVTDPYPLLNQRHSSILDLQILPDSKTLAFATTSGDLYHWCPPALPKLHSHRLAFGENWTAFAQLDDGETALLGTVSWGRTGNYRRELMFWNLKTKKAITHCDPETVRPQRIRASSDRNLALVIGQHRWKDSTMILGVYERASCSRVLQIESERTIRDCYFSPDNRILYVVIDPNIVEAWDLFAQKRLASFRADSQKITTLALSPDARSLALGGDDGIITVFDISKVRESAGEEKQWSQRRLADLWSQLSSRQASRGYDAMRDLLLSPKQTVELIHRRCKPASSVTSEDVEKLIKQLKTRDFQKRSRAFERLKSLDCQAEAQLRKTLKQKPTLEMRRRIQLLLSNLKAILLAEHHLQVSRAI